MGCGEVHGGEASVVKPQKCLSCDSKYRARAEHGPDLVVTDRCQNTWP